MKDMVVTITGLFIIIGVIPYTIQRLARHAGIMVKRARRREIKAYVDALYAEGAVRRRVFFAPPRLRAALRRRGRTKKPGRVEKSVNGLVKAMFHHMGLDDARVPRVVVVYSEFDSFSGAKRMGQFSSGGGTEIELILKKDHKASHILAVLAHECTHFYMHEKRLHAYPPLEEELMTDACAVLLGFHNQLYYGYQPLEKPLNSNYVQKLRIGYAKFEEVLYIRSKAFTRSAGHKRRRRQQQAADAKREKAAGKAQREEQQRQEQAAERLRQRAEEAPARILYARTKLVQMEALCEQLKGATCTQAQLEALQEYYTELAHGDITAALEAAEQAAIAAGPEALCAQAQRLEPWISRLEGWTLAAAGGN